jgi:hypothetical protein
MDHYVIGFISGIVVFTAMILLHDEFRKRRERRERKKFIKMLRSAIPTSATVMNYNV